MPFIKIKIENFRNLLNVQIDPSPSINYIIGLNGSGKTSLLEAIYMLGRGRSFRSSRIAPVINDNSDALQLFAVSQCREQIQRIGINRNSSEIKIKINGQYIHKLSQLAQINPIQILTPKSHEILERGPEFRRRFIEWGVFHVEHNYQQIHKRFTRSLSQRNADLRQGGQMLRIWDKELIEISLQLDELRQKYFDLLVSEFATVADKFGIQAITLEWRRGWSQKQTLEQSLQQSKKGDLKMGFTHVGPHRADMIISVNQSRASSILSRGQQKMVMIALTIAQSNVMKQKTSATPILLIDDLASELDTCNRELILDHVRSQKQQCFITSTDNLHVDLLKNERMFHVEQGEISDKSDLI